MEKRSCRYAVMGIMIAFISVKPLVSHWPVAASMDISSMMAGSAGVTSVWLRMVTNDPMTMTTSIIHCFFVSPMPCFLLRSFPASTIALMRTGRESVGMA